METIYKKKLLNEINAIPESLLPRFCRIVHALRTELTVHEAQAPGKGSLRGIWGGIPIDESLISEAEKSLFPYERKDWNP